MAFNVRKPIYEDDHVVDSTPKGSLPFSFSMKLSGVTFEGRQPVIARLKPGDSLSIKAIDNNPHDRNCVEVFDERGNSVGFIPKDKNRSFRDDMQKGFTFVAKVQQVTGGGSYNYGLVIDVVKEFPSDEEEAETLAEGEIIDSQPNDSKKSKKTGEYEVLGYSEYYDFLDELKNTGPDQRVVYVYHKRFKTGKVLFVNEDFITVKFDSVGDRTFKFPGSINVHLFKKRQ